MKRKESLDTIFEKLATLFSLGSALFILTTFVLVFIDVCTQRQIQPLFILEIIFSSISGASLLGCFICTLLDNHFDKKKK